MSQASIKITPSLPRVLPPAARAKVARAIESHLAAVTALTAFLDELDGDENLEPYLAGHSGTMDDREIDAGDEGEGGGADDDLDLSDQEPKHVPADMLDQSKWSGGVR